MTLYRKELWRVMRSLVYLATVVGIVLFMQSQGAFPSTRRVDAPAPGLQSYGSKASDDPALIMPEAVQSLYGSALANEYITYPNGFIKHVRLSEADRTRMDDILAALTGGAPSAAGAERALGVDGVSLTVQGGDGIQIVPDGDGGFTIEAGPAQGGQPEAALSAALSPDVTWEEFLMLMEQADDLLGGGSDYSQTYLRHRFGQVPMTYEEALTDHAAIVEEDRYTGAHARLFSDYAGIILSLLPVFPAVMLTMRDRRNIAPVLQTRRISALRLTLTRFAALLTAVMLPILAMDIVQTAIYAGAYGWSSIDPLAYLRYTLVWQMPSAMVAIASGMFLTTLTGTPIAIATQLLWWFLDMSGGNGAYTYVGRYAALVPRHNTLGQTQIYLEGVPTLLTNRLLIAALAAALLALTVLAYEMKRRGRLHVPVLGRRAVQPSL